MDLNVEEFNSKVQDMINEVLGLSAMVLYLYSNTTNTDEKLEYKKSIDEYNEYLVKLNKLKGGSN